MGRTGLPQKLPTLKALFKLLLDFPRLDMRILMEKISLSVCQEHFYGKNGSDNALQVAVSEGWVGQDLGLQIFLSWLL